MDINDIKHLAVERIFLVPDASEGQLGYVWCDDPAPGEGMDASEAVEYVRKDVYEAIIKRQANSAIMGMNAAKEHGSHMEAAAKRLHAESSPEALESEREANARLTELVTQLEHDRDDYRAAEELQLALRRSIQEERDALAAHVEHLDRLRVNVIEAIGDDRLDDLDISFYRDDMQPKMHPTTSLARRDLIKQAEALEKLYDDTARHVVINRGAVIDIARSLREQAEQC